MTDLRSGPEGSELLGAVFPLAMWIEVRCCACTKPSRGFGGGKLHLAFALLVHAASSVEGRDTFSGHFAFAGQFSENHLMASLKRVIVRSDPPRKAVNFLESANTRLLMVLSSTFVALRYSSATVRRCLISIIMISLSVILPNLSIMFFGFCTDSSKRAGMVIIPIC